MVIRDERDKTTVNTVIAERGEVWSDAGRAQMDLHNGQILRQPVDKANVQVIAFDTYSFDMGDFSAKTGKREMRLGELALDELLFMDKTSDYYKQNAPTITSEIHLRLSTPLYSLMYALLAVAYLGRPRTTREGRVPLLFSCFMIGAVARGLGIAGVNLAGKQFWTAIGLMYGVPFGLAAVCALMLAFNLPAPAISLPKFKLPLFFTGRAKAAAGGAA